MQFLFYANARPRVYKGTLQTLKVGNIHTREWSFIEAPMYEPSASDGHQYKSFEVADALMNWNVYLILLQGRGDKQPLYIT